MMFHADIAFLLSLIALVMAVTLLLKARKYKELGVAPQIFIGHLVVVLSLIMLVFSGYNTVRHAYFMSHMMPKIMMHKMMMKRDFMKPMMQKNQMMMKKMESAQSQIKPMQPAAPDQMMPKQPCQGDQCQVQPQPAVQPAAEPAAKPMQPTDEAADQASQNTTMDDESQATDDE